MGDGISEYYSNPMDCVNPTTGFDDSFSLISPILSLLPSSHFPSGYVSRFFMASSPPSCSTLDFTNIREDPSEDFPPSNFNRTIASGCPLPMEDSVDQSSPTIIRKSQSFSSQYSTSTLQSSLPTSRRHPGRPSKSQLAIQGSDRKRPTGGSLITVRRQMHKDSATRSRARLNDLLDSLWDVIPIEQRIPPKSLSDFDLDSMSKFSRADKIEIAISYMRKMQERLRKSF